MQKRRMLSTIVTVAVLLNMFSGMALTVHGAKPEKLFPDVGYWEEGGTENVAPAHWGSPYIYPLAERKIVEGYKESDPEGADSLDEETVVFKPDKKITRAEFMVILTKAFHVYNKDEKTDQFSDVKDGDWYMPYVASAVKAKLANEAGLGNGSFGHDLNMTRTQMMLFVARAMINADVGMSFPEGSEITTILNGFDDKDTIPEWEGAAEGVAFCKKTGLVEGYKEDGVVRIKAENDITRAEVCAIALRMINFMENSILSTPSPKPEEEKKWEDLAYLVKIVEGLDRENYPEADFEAIDAKIKEIKVLLTNTDAASGKMKAAIAALEDLLEKNGIKIPTPAPVPGSDLKIDTDSRSMRNYDNGTKYYNLTRYNIEGEDIKERLKAPAYESGLKSDYKPDLLVNRFVSEYTLGGQHMVSETAYDKIFVDLRNRNGSGNDVAGFGLYGGGGDLQGTYYKIYISSDQGITWDEVTDADAEGDGWGALKATYKTGAHYLEEGEKAWLYEQRPGANASALAEAMGVYFKNGTKKITNVKFHLLGSTKNENEPRPAAEQQWSTEKNFVSEVEIYAEKKEAAKPSVENAALDYSYRVEDYIQGPYAEEPTGEWGVRDLQWFRLKNIPGWALKNGDESFNPWGPDLVMDSHIPVDGTNMSDIYKANGRLNHVLYYSRNATNTGFGYDEEAECGYFQSILDTTWYSIAFEGTKINLYMDKPPLAVIIQDKDGFEVPYTIDLKADPGKFPYVWSIKPLKEDTYYVRFKTTIIPYYTEPDLEMPGWELWKIYGFDTFKSGVSGPIETEKPEPGGSQPIERFVDVNPESSYDSIFTRQDVMYGLKKKDITGKVTAPGFEAAGFTTFDRWMNGDIVTNCNDEYPNGDAIALASEDETRGSGKKQGDAWIHVDLTAEGTDITGLALYGGLTFYQSIYYRVWIQKPGREEWIEITAENAVAYGDPVKQIYKEESPCKLTDYLGDPAWIDPARTAAQATQLRTPLLLNEVTKVSKVKFFVMGNSDPFWWMYSNVAQIEVYTGGGLVEGGSK